MGVSVRLSVRGTHPDPGVLYDAGLTFEFKNEHNTLWSTSAHLSAFSVGSNECYKL